MHGRNGKLLSSYLQRKSSYQVHLANPCATIIQPVQPFPAAPKQKKIGNLSLHMIATIFMLKFALCLLSFPTFKLCLLGLLHFCSTFVLSWISVRGEKVARDHVPVLQVYPPCDSKI
jgi:hypothetical protein